MNTNRVEASKIIESSAPSLRMQFYVVTSTASSLETVKENLTEHRAYLRNLEERNVLFGAGSLWTDDEQYFEGDGMLIYRAESVVETSWEQNNKMRQSSLPIFDRSTPSLCNIIHRQIHQFEHRVLIRENSLGFNHLAQRAIERLNGIRGMDCPPNIHRIIKQWDDIFPMAHPNLANRWIQLVPLGRKPIQSHFSRFDGCRLVNRLEVSRDSLGILPRYITQTVADQMHDAQLNLGVRVERFNRLVCSPALIL